MNYEFRTNVYTEICKRDSLGLSPSFPSLLLSSFLIHLTEKAMAPHSSPLAWKIPWMEEPGRLQSMGSRRVGHD